jgi:hypothetical protein
MIKFQKTYNEKDDVFIVCTGSSLDGFDFDKLINKNVIAVKDAFKYLKTYDAVVSVDRDFFIKNRIALTNIDATMFGVAGFTNKPNFPPLGKTKTAMLKNTGVSGVDYNHGCIRFGWNSGYMSIGVAIQLGAKNIHLLGMDIHCENQYFYNKQQSAKENRYDYIIPILHELKNDLRPDIKIINWSINSRADMFERRNIKDLL